MIHFDSSESDSFSRLISIPPSKGLCIAVLSVRESDESDKEKTQRTSNNGYSREFQAMLNSLEEEEEDDDVEFSDKAGLCRREKKKRLGLNQVKALEKNFEVENKLDPERKLKLAQELNLKPRQVAVWFQNRRARWKTKQIERDYVSLKNNFEALQVDYSNLEKENRSLTLQLKELKTKMREENSEEGSTSVKEEEPVVSESENNVSIQRQDNNELCNENPLNDQTAPTSNSLMNWIQFQDSRSCWSSGLYQSHVVKREEQSLFNHTEESYNFFSVDQAPTLCWYFPEQ